AYRVPGGDTVVMNRLQEILQKTGMQIDFSSDYHPDLSDYDLVHIFNLTVPHYTEAFAKNAINAGVPYVVTTLQEDFRKYQIKANFATRLFWMYRDKKQLPQIFEMGLAELLTLPEARDTTSLIAGTFAEALLACGASEGKTLNRLFPNTAIEIAPFGCSVKDIDVGPELFERKYGVKDFILCVGRMESRKNQLMLLKALEFDDIPIVFCIGATHEKSEYMRLCREFKRKGKTIFAEKLSDEMLVSAYRAAKVHCLPSWFELPGLVTLEAAYYGCNAVASNWGSIGDYATTDDCWFISPDDPNGMRTVLLDAMMAPRSSKSSNKIKDFSWERSAKTVTNIYNKVVGDFKTRNMHSFLEISNEPRPTPSMSSFFGSILEEIDNKNFAEAIKTYKNGKVNYPPCEELDKFDTLMIKLSGKLGGQS
ncbi:MAG: glycosyltransferase, partial [Fibrobacteres bacterium]|nr:glycosyltransferase [Fibrobacterota bacterium]